MAPGSVQQSACIHDLKLLKHTDRLDQDHNQYHNHKVDGLSLYAHVHKAYHMDQLQMLSEHAQALKLQG